MKKRRVEYNKGAHSTHSEAPKNRQKGLPPSQTKLLFQSHPNDSFYETESPSPISTCTLKKLRIQS